MPLNETAEKRRVLFTGALVAVIVTLGFFLLYWNRFAGIRSGIGGYGGGEAFLRGLRPYRDYFAASTPLYILTCATALKLFGNALIVTRGFGIFERLVMASLIFAWLSRFFASRHALVAAIVTMIASAGDIADPISSYNHETIMWAIGSGFAASFALDWEKYAVIASVISGFLAGLSFATKQTMGLGATIFIPLVVVLYLARMASVRKAASFLGLFIAGWFLSAGVLLFWLGRLGILHEFLIDVFLKGPAAKAGSPGDFFFRDFLILRILWLPAALAVIALPLSWRAMWRSSGMRQDTSRDSLPVMVRLGLLCAVCIAAGALISWAGVPRVKSLTKPTIYLVLLAPLGLLGGYIWAWLRGSITRRQAQFSLLATVSWVMAFMVSLSFPIFEAMVLPGLGFVVALALDGFSGWRRCTVYALCAAVLITQTCVKLNRPFGFSDWEEPSVSTATQASTLPEFRGIRLPPGEVAFIDGTTRIVAENSTASDTIFTYPEMAIFYSLTHRRPPTVSGSHNMDVVNDALAREEAARLLAARPAVLIYYREHEDNLEYDELLWRRGRRSGQRDIIAAMETLASQYRLAATYRVPPDSRPVNVYVRP